MFRRAQDDKQKERNENRNRVSDLSITWHGGTEEAIERAVTENTSTKNKDAQRKLNQLEGRIGAVSRMKSGGANGGKDLLKCSREKGERIPDLMSLYDISREKMTSATCTRGPLHRGMKTKIDKTGSQK